MDFNEEARQHQVAIEFERRQRNELAGVLSAQDELTDAGEMRRDDDNWHEIAWLRHGLNIPATNDQKEYDE